MTAVIHPKYLVAANCKRGPLLFNKNEHIMAYVLIEYGEFAEDELERIERYLKPGMMVIDVGANIGTHATAFEQMVQPGGFVYAIEPHHCNFNILCGNIAMRATQRVIPYRAMAGSQDRIHILPMIDAEEPANFGAAKALGESVPENGGLPTPEIRIDSIGLPRCDFIKIDVEGSELEVLDGAKETIAKHHPAMLIECLEESGTEGALKYLLATAGYSMYWLHNRLFRPENFRGSRAVKDGTDRNIIAVHGEAPELIEGLERVK